MIANRQSTVPAQDEIETLPSRAESRVLGPGLRVHIPPTRVAEKKPSAATLTARELRRRCWHILPGFLPFILWAIPHRDPFSWDLKGGALAVIVVLGISIFRQFKTFNRSESDENGKMGAILGYALSVTLMMLLIPAYGELAFTVLAILAFGDGFATLGGLLLGGPKLPWNRGKTWSGFACFIACATLMGSVIYWGEAKPGIPFLIALQIAAIAATVSAVAESIPSKINDNIRVGLSASSSVICAQWLLIGFHAPV